jgi:hypothetical protein
VEATLLIVIPLQSGIGCYYLHFIKTATPIPTFPLGKEFSNSSFLAYPKSFLKERTAISFIMAFENTFIFIFPLLSPALKGGSYSFIQLSFRCRAESDVTISISSTPQHPSQPSLRGRSFTPFFKFEFIFIIHYSLIDIQYSKISI